MKLRELIEEYYDTIKPSYPKDQISIPYDVFKNPTKKEMAEASSGRGHYLRFIIRPKLKELYVFDFNLLHVFVAKKLKIQYKLSNDENTIFANGVYLKGKINTQDEDAVEAVKKHDWLKGYFNEA